MDTFLFSGKGHDTSLREKFLGLNWFFLLLLVAIASIGFAMLYSVAGGSLDPWAKRQMIRFAFGMALLIVVAFMNIRLWLALAYPVFALTLVLLLGVEFLGLEGKGAQRWINLGIIRLQPSEMIKVTLILALARFYHGMALEDISRPGSVVVPFILIALPVALIVRQPDLGTALLVCVVGLSIIFMAGLSWRYFIAAGVAGMAAIPIVWSLLLDYQKQRVLTFLNPGNDPLGAGYHILQSKIALGSGGLSGKGFMEGTQAHLNFLPEKHTDFIFTMLAEELGLVGGITLMALYFIVLMFGLSVALQTRSHFGRLLAMGISINFFLYIFINIAMVMGMLPVVGVPLPLVSYGGTAMLTLMGGFGLLMCVYMNRNVEISTNTGTFW